MNPRNWAWFARLESAVRLMVPFTRRAEMNRLIRLVAEENDCTMTQAFALMYAEAEDWERPLLDPYRPKGTNGHA